MTLATRILHPIKFPTFLFTKDTPEGGDETWQEKMLNLLESMNEKLAKPSNHTEPETPPEDIEPEDNGDITTIPVPQLPPQELPQEETEEQEQQEENPSPPPPKKKSLWSYLL